MRSYFLVYSSTKCLIFGNTTHQFYFYFKAALSIFGMISGPLLGLYLLGMLFRTSNSIVSILHYWEIHEYKGTISQHKHNLLIKMCDAYRKDFTGVVFILQGGLVGLIIGLVLTLWVGIGGQIYPPTAEKTNPLQFNITGCDNKTGQNYTTTAPWTSPVTLTPHPEWVILHKKKVHRALGMVEIKEDIFISITVTKKYKTQKWIYDLSCPKTLNSTCHLKQPTNFLECTSERVFSIRQTHFKLKNS